MQRKLPSWSLLVAACLLAVAARLLGQEGEGPEDLTFLESQGAQGWAIALSAAALSAALLAALGYHHVNRVAALLLGPVGALLAASGVAQWLDRPQVLIFAAEGFFFGVLAAAGLLTAGLWWLVAYAAVMGGGLLGLLWFRFDVAIDWPRLGLAAQTIYFLLAASLLIPLWRRQSLRQAKWPLRWGYLALAVLTGLGAMSVAARVDHARRMAAMEFVASPRATYVGDWLTFLRGSTLRSIVVNQPVDLAGIHHVAAYKGLEVVNLQGPFVRDEHLAYIRDWSRVHTLILLGTSATDEGLRAIRRPRSLRALVVRDTGLSDDAWSTFKESPLTEKVVLSVPGVHGKGLRHLARKLPPGHELQWTLAGMRFDAGLKEAWSAASDFVLLDLRGARFPDEALKGLPPVATLRLDNTPLTDAGMAHLPPVSRLHLDDTRITDEGLRHIRLEGGSFNLSLVNTRVAGSGLAELRVPVAQGNRRPFMHLDLTRTLVNNDAIMHLMHLPISTLRLNHTRVTADCLPELVQMPALHDVWLHGPEVRFEDVKNLSLGDRTPSKEHPRWPYQREIMLSVDSTLISWDQVEALAKTGIWVQRPIEASQPRATTGFAVPMSQ